MYVCACGANTVNIRQHPAPFPATCSYPLSPADLLPKNRPPAHPLTRSPTHPPTHPPARPPARPPDPQTSSTGKHKVKISGLMVSEDPENRPFDNKAAWDWIVAGSSKSTQVGGRVGGWVGG